MTDASTSGCVAVVGVAKHAGKTTALNRLVQEARRTNASVGLCSIGLDGESIDAIHDVDKPPVFCTEGQLVASLRQPLASSSCDLEMLEVLGGDTPLGRLHLARCRSDGRVILAGVRSQRHLERVTRAISSRGADTILVDGAFGRSMTTGARTVDRLILAAGAVSGRTPRDIVQTAAPIIEQIHAPSVARGWQADLLNHAESQDAALVGGPATGPRPLAASSALVGLQQSSDLWDSDTNAIAIPGAVTDSVAESLLDASVIERRDRRPWLLAPDVSSFHLSPEVWRELRASWRILLGRSIELTAIAINPRRPDGTAVDPEALRRAFKQWMVNQSIGPLPVWDPRTADRVATV
jgi:hypothetical protein